MAITLTWSVETLEEAAALIAELQGRNTPSPKIVIEAATPKTGAAVAQTNRMSPSLPEKERLRKWITHLGPGSRGFWKLVAVYANDHDTFTFEDLSEFARENQKLFPGVRNREPAGLRSYHRNSYRAINRFGEADPLTNEWDHEKKMYVYQIAPVTRDAIAEILH